MSESKPNPVSEPMSNENVERILALLRAGDEKINLSGFRDVVLVLGNTGSGKSTLTHFLAGNNDDLISSEVGENSGEFIISDTNNKISVNNTIISKTTFPELIVDPETKIVFIDCPGFNDSRDEAYDISTAYFIKKVLEGVKNVKILLTVNHPSVRKGVNRNDFLQLLEHVTILLKRIEKYVDGVALVATKVDNNYNRNGDLVSDASVIQNIAQFLPEVRESIKTMKGLNQVYTSEFKRVENEYFLQNSKILLDALLQKNGTEYTRLGIFRRPDSPGRLSGIKLLQHGKKVLKRMIKNNLKYVLVDMRDVGYAVSDKSKNIINELVNEIDKNIVADVAQINRIVIDYSQNVEEKMIDDDMYSLREYFDSTFNALARISTIEELAKADQLVSLMREKLPLACSKASQTQFNDVKNLGKFLDFLQDVSGKKFDSSAWKWTKQLEGAVNYALNSLKWYDFLTVLHVRLSEYDVQANTSRFHIPVFNSSESFALEKSVDFSKFFDEVSNAEFLKVVNFKDLGKVSMDGIKIRYFDRVIESTLQDSSVVSYDSAGGKFQITANYVKLSDVVENSDLELCEAVQIFAKNTIFIDADLRKNVDVSIIAPNWRVIGSRTINLNGLPGSHHLESTAANGDTYGNLNGRDGLPGNPGQSAGHFFGIGDVFKDDQNLSVSAIGGAGGNGQHGGDGAAGRDGESHYIYNDDYHLTCSRDQECYTKIGYSKSGLFNLNVKGEVIYTKYGSPGGRGGDAGRGGAPGIGGNPGNVTLISAGNTKPTISRYVAKGQAGGYGLHGKCGPGGIGGAHQRAWYYFGTWSSTENHVDRSNAGHAKDGSEGTCIYFSSLYNANLGDRQEPKVRNFSYPPSFAVSDFRTKIMDNFYNCLNKRRALEFYKLLHKKEIVQYDNIDIIYKELETLEMFHNRLSPDISNMIYGFLCDRIEEQAKIVTQGKQRKLLDFLSLTVSSKLTRLANRSESRLVTDPQTYFDLMKTADVAKIRRFFLSRAGDEIKSAENFVKIIRNDVSDVIERTTDEIVKLSGSDINNELGQKMLKFKLFSHLKTIVDFLGFSGSLAEAELALANTLRVISALPTAQVSLSEVDGRLISAHLSSIEEILGKPIDALRNSAAKERKTLKSLGMEYDVIGERLHDVEMTLQSRKPIAVKSFVSVHSKIGDMVEALAAINGDLPNDTNGKAQEISNKFMKEMELIGFDADLFLALIDSKINEENLFSIVGSLRSLSDGLDVTNEELFNLLSPVFRTIRRNMTGDRYKPENLTAIRMMVYETLDNVKSLVYRFISQFEIDEDLQLMVENLDEAGSQMMAIFNEVLPSHHDRALLNGFQAYLEEEKELGNSPQSYLIEVVKGNGLFYEYQRLADAVKKFISPFDASNFTEPILPAIGRSSASYQSPIISNVNLLQSKWQTSELNSENSTLTEDFSSDDQNGPFFVWGSDNYQESISKLLLGREVALKSSNFNKNRQFVKFNDIRLRFQSADPSTQRSLDEDLKDFNVVMTHTGSSYFTVCDRIQLINQEATKFVYNFTDTVVQNGSNDGPVPSTMSPYTTWIFKLNPIDENATFGSLLPYRKKDLSIELEGRASFVETYDRKVCQKIAQSHQSAPSTSADNVDQSRSIRKRRDVDSAESVGIFNLKYLKSLNPLNYFIDNEPDPRFEHSSEPQLLQWNSEPNQPATSSPSFNMNSALTLVDFFVRNVTKVKPYQSRETSVDADRARAIAMTILFKFENLLAGLSDDNQILDAWLQRDDPVAVMRLIEKYILDKSYSKVVDFLSTSANLDPSIAKKVRQEIRDIVNESLHGGDSAPNTDHRNVHDTSFFDGAVLIDGRNAISNGNFNQSLLR